MLSLSVLLLSIYTSSTTIASPISNLPFNTSSIFPLSARAVQECPRGNPLAARICTGTEFTGQCHYHNPGPDSTGEKGEDDICYKIQSSKGPNAFPDYLVDNVLSFGPDLDTACILFQSTDCTVSCRGADSRAWDGVVSGNVQCPGWGNLEWNRGWTRGTGSFMCKRKSLLTEAALRSFLKRGTWDVMNCPNPPLSTTPVPTPNS